jgi:hypothetical protein
LDFASSTYETIVVVDYMGFLVPELKDIHGAHVNATSTSITLLIIDFYINHGMKDSSSLLNPNVVNHQG